MPFDECELQLLHETEEVEIETTLSGEKEPHRATVWIVVVAGEVYVRSVNGERAHWYRHLIEHPIGAIQTEDRRIPVRAVHVPGAQSLIHDRVNEAYRRKYSLYPHDVAWITGASVVPATLRLERHHGTAD